MRRLVFTGVEMNIYIRYGIVWLLYLFYTWEDVRYRKVWRPAAIMVCGAALIVRPAGSGYSVSSAFLQCMLGMLPGAFLWIVSRMSSGMGTGDVWAILAAGAWLGFEHTMAMLLLSLLPAALFSLVLLLRGGDKKSSFPFLPFLLCGLSVLIVVLAAG